MKLAHSPVQKGESLGLMEVADGGILWLDEIASMPVICRPSCCGRLKNSLSGGLAAQSPSTSTCR